MRLAFNLIALPAADGRRLRQSHRPSRRHWSVEAHARLRRNGCSGGDQSSL